MVSTKIPEKYKTDINVLKNNIVIKPIPSPKEFYSQSENQKTISAQIQQARNTVYTVAPSKQSVLPQTVAQDLLNKTSGLAMDLGKKITVPTSPAQPKINKTYPNVIPWNDVTPPPEPKEPTPVDIAKLNVQAIGQDIVRGIDTTVSSAFDFTKSALVIAAIIGTVILLKR